MTAALDAAAMLARAQDETGLDDYGDPTLPERFALAVEHLNDIGMDANGIDQAESVCHWLLTSRLEFIEDRYRYPIAAEVIDQPDVRDGRAALGHHAHARADGGGPARARAPVLGGDVPVTASRRHPAGRSPPGPGRRRLARDQREDAEMATQPPLQRHAR